MSGITRRIHVAMIVSLIPLMAGGARAGKPLQREGVVKDCTRGASAANLVLPLQEMRPARSLSPTRPERPVLTPEEIAGLLADIRSRGKGSVLVVECSGAFGYATIQSAINAAVDGDIIVVLPNDCNAEGRYYENIDFLGKAITVQSAQPTNPAVVAATIIDGNASGTVVTFKTGEGADSVLDGLTITNGHGGVHCKDSSPTLAHCTICGNHGQSGGGVYCYNSSPTLIICAITENTVDSHAGAAFGGGLYCDYGSSPILTDCVIRDNTSAHYGGGLACRRSSMPTLTNCTITCNRAAHGGGVYSWDSDPSMTNCKVNQNTAIKGGGFYLSSSNPTLNSCTISTNEGSDQGGGLLCSSSNPTLTNCILWGDLPQEVFVEGDGTPSITYCDVQGGWEGEGNLDVDPLFAFADDFHLMSGSPCIDAGTNTPPGGLPSQDSDGNPRPLDGDGDFEAIADIGAYELNLAAPTIAASPAVVVFSVLLEQVGELPQGLMIRNAGAGSLQWTLDWDADWLQAEPAQGESTGEVDTVSLAVDAGTLTPGIHDTTLKISSPLALNSPRIVPVKVYVTRIFHVPAEYGTIQQAIDAAGIRGDEVVVADGIYTGSGNKNLSLHGKEITVRSASGDPATCIIDCENDGRGFVFHSGETSATLVSGLTVRNGRESVGAGMYFAAASNPTVRRCHLIDNAADRFTAPGAGGGVYCISSASPTLIDCVISGNTASYGGGVHCTNSSNPTLVDCVISDNTADSGGSMYCTNQSSPAIVDCIISNNSAHNGGAVYCCQGARPSFSICQIKDNWAAEDGGGMACYGASATLTDCAITNNESSLYAGSPRFGGGLFFADESIPTLRNCVISGNTSGYGGGIYSSDSDMTLIDCVIRDNTSNNGGGLYVGSTSILALTKCLVSHNEAGYGAGLYCDDCDATLTDCSIDDNEAASAGGGLYSRDCGPTLTNCTVNRNNAGRGGGFYCAYSNPALTNCTIMGNSALDQGAACSAVASSAAFVNCTLAGNQSVVAGGGLYSDESEVSMVNCLLWGDEPREIDLGYGEAPILTYCDIAGGWDGEGNIDVDPHFAIAGDYHLAADSPCIDAGTNTPPGGLSDVDVDGNGRCVDGDNDSLAVVDIGAHEFHAGISVFVVGPTYFEFVTMEETPSAGQELVIANAGSGGLALQWSLASDATWLHVDTIQGELQPGETQTVTLSVDVSGLIPGTYAATLNVDAVPAPAHPRPIDVLLIVGNTLHVPAEYATIQEAVNAANMPGDVVLLADGVYTGTGNKDIEFFGKPITVQSASGDPTCCIIDCEGAGRGFYFHAHESDSSRIEGLTIRNGLAGNGGGILCCYASPSIVNCIIRDNQSTGSGGGVSCSQPFLRLERCEIFGNRAASSGGGISCSYNTLSLLNECTIRGNTAGIFGGGVGLSSGALQVTHCAITDNEAGSYGGGIGGSVVYDGSVSLQDCAVRNNHAVSSGGGIGLLNCPAMVMERCVVNHNTSGNSGGGFFWGGGSAASLVLRDCVISGNTAARDAGGVFMRSGVSEWTNCLLVANRAGLTGGGTFCTYMMHADFVNCTFAANIAGQSGGAVRDYSGAGLVFSNCILWGDTPEEIQLPSGGSASLSYCDIQGGWEGEGNIDVDPGLAFTDDPHLTSGSPCIDAGTDTPPGGLPNEDADGNPRSLDGDGDSEAVADIGAYEFNPAVPTIAASPAAIVFSIPVGQVGELPQGLMIRNAGSGTLQWTLDWDVDWLQAEPAQGESAGEVDTVSLSVDTGTLTPGIHNTTLRILDPLASNSPRIVPVKVYVTRVFHVPTEYGTIQAAIDATVFPHDEVVVADGVYTGSGNRHLSLRGKEITVRSASGDPAKCIIDCEMNGPGFSFYSGETRESVVDGFTVRNGSGNEGGGVYVHGASPTLSRCCFTTNAALSIGGAMYCYNASPVLIDCTFIGNTASSYGAGIYCYNANLTLTDCTISGNAAASQGGGVYARNSTLTFFNCVFSENSASYAGGGVCCYSQVNLTSLNCAFSRNTARAGGAAYFYYAQPLFSNCVIDGNSASEKGGGLYCDGSSAMLTNCTFTGNTASQIGGALYCYGGSPALTNCILWGDQPQQIVGYPNLSYCNIQGGWTGAGVGNIDADPLFVDADGPDGVPGTEDDDLRLQPASPCIDAGDPDFVTEPGATDLDGHSRIMGCGVDIGAYEFVTGAPDSGDLDGSGVLDSDDIAVFIEALLADGGPAAVCVADLNADDRIDGLDIQLFTELFLGGG